MTTDHTPTIADYLTNEQIALAGYMSDAVGAADLSALRLYGSRSRPMSGSWARIKGAAYITADYGATGFHTWVVVPYPLEQAVIESYELTPLI